MSRMYVFIVFEGTRTVDVQHVEAETLGPVVVRAVQACSGRQSAAVYEIWKDRARVHAGQPLEYPEPL
jgi:hypothetical protein